MYKIDGRSADAEFGEFLRIKYSNIAQAHFNVSESISTFFRHSGCPSVRRSRGSPCHLHEAT